MQQMTELVTVREAGGGPRDTKEEESAGMGGWKTMEDHRRPWKTTEGISNGLSLSRDLKSGEQDLLASMRGTSMCKTRMISA